MRWKHALEIIPGGNQIVSKRPDRYAPGQYPAYYKFAKGAEIVDEYNKKYTDMCTMGIGACTLGYGNPDVDAAVVQAIAAGQFSSLNCEEELQLAEELLKINPKMDQVRFARTGGEACAIAAKIAEEYRKDVDPCYYLHHGYSGWYLGNPEQTYGISFNTKEEMEKYRSDLISYVIMEPVRNHPEESVQLMKDVRKWCTENNVPLIFDEVTSGFRENIGGYHAIKGIYPDIVVYGKAMGNGYAISAVVGTKDIMECADKTFISSTFWSERLGYAAALETLHQYRERRVPEHLVRIGNRVKHGWKTRSENCGVGIDIMGIPPLAGFRFRDNHETNVTYLTQEMLKRHYLAGDHIYTSLAHTEEMVDDYLDHFERILLDIAEGNANLDGPVRTMGWRRPN